MFSKLKVGDEYFDKAISSFSLEQSVAKQFSEHRGGYNQIILKTKSRGREFDLTSFSEFDDEFEVIISGGDKFRVIDIKEETIKGDSVTVIYLE